MKHRVRDVSPVLNEVWGHVDSATLAAIVAGSVDALYHHWNTFLQVLWHPRRRVRTLTKAETDSPSVSLSCTDAHVCAHTRTLT
jgi:hypothetical protein